MHSIVQKNGYLGKQMGKWYSGILKVLQPYSSSSLFYCKLYSSLYIAQSIKTRRAYKISNLKFYHDLFSCGIILYVIQILYPLYVILQYTYVRYALRIILISHLTYFIQFIIQLKGTSEYLGIMYYTLSHQLCCYAMT